ncbi:lipid IV(A) 3-deoxy-D-manno-octulosonic acid transferase [Vibrio sp. 10N.261.46.E12]|uniref:lipid IV(A) 3-deoxy-D-manno-octulosonic acid transferase n=1 Tax=unclassified Vibrio TaxID=2614977 RepID=UPI0009762E21|nr:MULTISPECIES: lipid IV(A) 3-deoxy-D-manno-octulosonic acid transferase [unclassified Vibrio]OMO38370.1 3-deoxy-D-manno-octulosonic acid transferase [Vibrio sp. 10N.261.45.E1]PMJ26061.1 3-deoxy-D-manno-octulosonic acid transferase [Vibrio sp. 10N.286.45.B6]PML89626.1 3-deoxy-D-manno-octulosonic acid transferase [Vibrio sp. 10N.261.49.E11]PMM69706.1 3-deoxy-D-manno-octulosonic acid transferase [Vibrio sp. 10N.261.46.F12]PMM90696.1 3-deoxy-D-manno-octulosonic acid transferase [Vibrio sp. 10N.2
MTLIRILYTLALLLAAPFLLFSLLKRKPNKPVIGSRWKELFGYGPVLNCRSQEVIWIHAVSVGETIAVTPFIKALKQQNPDLTVVLTTTTATGAKQAESLKDLVTHRYMPIDFCFTVSNFVNRINPSKLIIVETEIWPNTIEIVSRSKTPIYILNARLSEKSFKNYQKVQKLFITMAGKLTKVLCIHQDDAKRFSLLGVEENKIHITGSIKFDIKTSDSAIKSGQALRRTFGTKRPIWVAASTHSGEDEKILKVHKKILEKKPEALLILIPRHPERFNLVKKLARREFSTNSRTSKIQSNSNIEVYIADTMGEMITILSSSDICFMGGSFLGSKVGGHNLLEPAALGIPTLIGPSYFNFKDITKQLSDVGATEVIHTEEELTDALLNLFNNPKELKEKGIAAYAIVEKNTGAINKSLCHILG